MKILFLIRGVSGSGKSTLAKKIAAEQECEYFEADQFFETLGGYKFDISFIKEAHAWCRAQVCKEMFDGNDVIVSNTFTKYWELQGYLELAAKFGYHVHMITCTGRYQNVHNVPEEKVQQMRDRFESSESVYEMASDEGYGDILKYE